MKTNFITLGIIVLVVVGLYFVNKSNPIVNNQVVKESPLENEVNPLLYKVKIVPPAGWDVVDTFPNAAIFGSKDLKADEEFKNISAGSLLVISVEEGFTSTLEETAQRFTDGAIKESEIQRITVNGEPGIRYTTKVGAGNNTQVLVHTIKDGALYTVFQAYKLNGANPYPQVLDDFVEALKLP